MAFVVGVGDFGPARVSRGAVGWLTTAVPNVEDHGVIGGFIPGDGCVDLCMGCGGGVGGYEEEEER